MKKQKYLHCIFCVIIGLCITATGVNSSIQLVNNTNLVDQLIPDMHAQQILIFQGIGCESEVETGISQEIREFSASRYDAYELGDIIWQYTITGGSDNSVKAIAPIADINDDGIDDVIICSEDYYIRCFDGAALGTGIIIWELFIYSGKLNYQNELFIRDDVDNDGYQDVVVGTPWGDRSIHTISGRTGTILWTHDTHEYDTGGWIYQVDCQYDYDNDDIIDVLAVTGGTATGPRRAYCLDGENGNKIWECPLGSPRGPGFSVIGVEDFTGDGKPDVVAGASDSSETTGYAYGINGDTGSIEWSFTTAGSSVWALKQIDDITNDDIKDIIIGDFTGHIYGLDATSGTQEFSNSIGTVIITRFEKLDDVNADSHPDIIAGHSTISTTQVIDGYTGGIIWSQAVADQPWMVDRIADITGDAINDVLVGTLYQNGYCYFIDGVDGTILHSINYGEAVDAIAAISDAIGDASMEMVAGGREGKLTCYSGGKNASSNPIKLTANFTATPTSGGAPLTVEFTDLSTAENTTITSWEWDFNNDGMIDSTSQHPTWIYTTEDIYTVSLEISDGIVYDTEIKEDYITVAPTSLEIRPITGGLF